MITLDTIVAMAIRDRTVLDELAEALRNDLCVSNPFLREIVKFADEFLLTHRKLPEAGDWDMWVKGLKPGMEHDGTLETLGRVLAVDTSDYTPAFFAEQALPALQHLATQSARSRINEVGDAMSLDGFLKLSDQLDSIRVGSIKGLARLDDIETWARPVRQDELVSTGFVTLDSIIGGWGKELWLVFADSGVGKSMFLQNCGASMARVGKRVLHVSLEIGVRPQIHRYYRQLARTNRGEFNQDIGKVKEHLRHWFRFAKGEVLLLEFPAYKLEPDDLKRTIDRVGRTYGEIDALVLDYMDLMTLPRQLSSRSEYADLGKLTHLTRSLCPQYDLTVLSASQAVRRPERAGRLTLRDMGDSYNKVRGSDGILGLCQTDEEEEVFQGRLDVLKARDSGGRGRSIGLYINKDLALIADRRNPGAKLLMEQLGHNTMPPAWPPQPHPAAAAAAVSTK